MAELAHDRLWQVHAAGLAALLYTATPAEAEASLPVTVRNALRSAYLTSRVRFGELCDVAEEVIDACRARDIPVTLLKGISVAERLYPEGHLRPMGDIDVLVARGDAATLEAEMLERGCIRKADYVVIESDPHGTPLYHKERKIWIEVHTGLFSADSMLRDNGLFGPANVAAQSVASTFKGREVYRLSDELQLAYIASYWLRDLTRNHFHPSFALPLLDAIYLLKSVGRTLDWEALLAQLDNEMATASVYVMLKYLAERQLLAATCNPPLARIAARQGIVGAAEMRIISALLDAYLLGDRAHPGSFMDRHPMFAKTILGSLLGRGSRAKKLLALPWHLIFPPEVPGRYSIRYQRDRAARMLGKRD